MVGKTKVYLLLDELEKRIDSQPRVPLTDRVMVDAEKLLDLVEEIRVAVDEMNREASGIPQQTAAELPPVQEKPRAVDTEWRDEALTDAAQRAMELRVGAVGYADDTLSALADTLEKALRVVEKGRSELQKERSEIMASKTSESA